MAIKIEGVEALMINLRQVGERAKRGASKEIVSGADEIQRLAREYAPVDEGNLEDAIKVESDRSGIRGRVQAFVYVDESHPSSTGETVGEYAAKMHEQLAPYGSGAYNLGPLSRIKQESGKDVGGKFLERAAAQERERIVNNIKRAVKKAIKE